VTAAVEVFPAADWAARVAEELAGRVAANPRLRLCLPTGDTPAPVYAALPAALARARATLRDATVVSLDEWLGLAPGDPARGDVRLRHDLLDHLPEPPAAVHLFRVDALPPEAAVAEVDAVAARGLDLVLLGLGMNGHVGFNEPGSTADSPSRIVELAPASRRAAVERYGAGRGPSGGATLGLARLLEAAEIWLLATGARKRDVLHRALEDAESPDCPATYLRRHRRLRVLADDAAVRARWAGPAAV
jgi:glucosamine-6-phosphate deaminase